MARLMLLICVLFLGSLVPANAQISPATFDIVCKDVANARNEARRMTYIDQRALDALDELCRAPQSGKATFKVSLAESNGICVFGRVSSWIINKLFYAMIVARNWDEIDIDCIILEHQDYGLPEFEGEATQQRVDNYQNYLQAIGHIAEEYKLQHCVTKNLRSSYLDAKFNIIPIIDNKNLKSIFIKRSILPYFNASNIDIDNLKLRDVSICRFSIFASSIKKSADVDGASFDRFHIQNSRLEADLNLNGIRTLNSLMLDSTESTRELIVGNHHGPRHHQNIRIPIIGNTEKKAHGRQAISEAGIALHDEVVELALRKDWLPGAVLSGELNISNSKWSAIWFNNVLHQERIGGDCSQNIDFAYLRGNTLTAGSVHFRDVVFGNICEFNISRANISQNITHRNLFINVKMSYFGLNTRNISYINSFINNIKYSLSNIDHIYFGRSEEVDGIEDNNKYQNIISNHLLKLYSFEDLFYGYGANKSPKSKNKTYKYNIFNQELNLDFSKIGILEMTGAFIGDLKCPMCRVDSLIMAGIVRGSVDFQGARIERLALGYEDMGLFWCHPKSMDEGTPTVRALNGRPRFSLSGATIRQLHANAVDLSLQDCKQPAKDLADYEPVPTLFDSMRLEGIGNRLTNLEHVRLPGDGNKQSAQKVAATGKLTSATPMFGIESRHLLKWLKSPGAGQWEGSQLLGRRMSLENLNLDTFTSIARLMDNAGFSDAAKDLKIEASRLKKERADDFIDKVKLVLGAPLHWGFKNENALVAALLLLITGAWVSALYRAYPHVQSPPTEKQFQRSVLKNAPKERVLPSMAANVARIAVAFGFLCCIAVIAVGFYMQAYSENKILAVISMLVALLFIGTVLLAVMRRGFKRATIPMSWGDFFAGLFKINIHDIFFSLDRLIPIVGWHDHWAKYPMIGQVGRNYYYFHRLFGLLIFVYAFSGITGLLD